MKLTSETLARLLDGTDWRLLRTQNSELVRLISSVSDNEADALGAITHFVDQILNEVTQ